MTKEELVESMKEILTPFNQRLEILEASVKSLSEKPPIEMEKPADKTKAAPGETEKPPAETKEAEIPGASTKTETETPPAETQVQTQSQQTEEDKKTEEELEAAVKGLETSVKNKMLFKGDLLSKKVKGQDGVQPPVTEKKSPRRDMFGQHIGQ